VVEYIAIRLGSALFLALLALWSTRRVSPLWPAAVFALGRGAIAYLTGVTALTAVGTGVAALLLGALYFWVLQRLQGSLWWWLVLVVGIVLLSI
jgi:hypothetical protein